MDMDGLDTILRRMESLKDSSKVAVMRSAIRAGLNVIGKQMKKDVDPKVKLGRKAVKSRFKKGKTRIEAKVGFGVGPRNKKQVASNAARAKQKGGVGIGPNNIHWWVAGTKKRTTGSRRGKRVDTPEMNRGSMPAQQPGLASTAYEKSQGKIKSEMIKRGALQLTKEVNKLKRIK